MAQRQIRRLHAFGSVASTPATQDETWGFWLLTVTRCLHSALTGLPRAVMAWALKIRNIYRLPIPIQNLPKEPFCPAINKSTTRVHFCSGSRIRPDVRTLCSSYSSAVSEDNDKLQF